MVELQSLRIHRQILRNEGQSASATSKTSAQNIAQLRLLGGFQRAKGLDVIGIQLNASIHQSSA